MTLNSDPRRPDPIWIVIATSGRPRLLKRLLQSLEACSKPESFREALIVDSAVEEGTEGLCRDFKDRFPLRYFRISGPGKAAALNAGLSLVSRGLVVFLDDDVALDAGSLEAYAAASAGAGQIYFGGPVSIEYEARPVPWLLPYLPPSARGWEPSPRAARRRDLSFMGMNWAARLDDVRQAGGFNEELGWGTGEFPMGDDSDLQRRLRAIGCVSRFVPGARARHFVPVSRCSAEFAVERVSLHAAEHARRFGRDRDLNSLSAIFRRLARLVLVIFVPGPPIYFVISFMRGELRGILRGYEAGRRARPQGRSAI